MGSTLREILGVSLCFVAFVFGVTRANDVCEPVTDPESHKHPDYFNTLSTSFTLIVEMTLVTQNITYYVENVRERVQVEDSVVEVEAVYVRGNGSEVVVRYYPDTGEFVNQYNDYCRLSGSDEPPFSVWGWFVDKSFGPATLLRQTHDFNMQFLGDTFDVDGVMTERYRACEAEGAVELFYSYSIKSWEMPEKGWFNEGDGRIPVEFQVSMMDHSASYMYHVVKFSPVVESRHLLEIPRGLSCEGMVAVGNRPVPAIPQHFSQAQESVVNPFIDGVIMGNKQYLEKTQMTYSEELALTRLLVVPGREDQLTDHTLDIIHDFNTGVEYTINRMFGNCSRRRMLPYSFDALAGNLLGPNQLFHLDDTYGYVGERGSRGISGDLFTSTRDDIPDPDVDFIENFPKAVLEYYFAQGVEMTPDGRLPLNMPLRSDLFAYNRSDPQEVVGMWTNNYYDFREVGLLSEAEFSVEECFEKHSDDWSYVLITFSMLTQNQLAAVRDLPDLFRHNVYKLLVKIGHLSPVRIASIDLSEGMSGLVPNATKSDVIYASVKLLERAPYIYSFSQPMDEPLQVPGLNEKSIENIGELEDCARLCYEDRAMDCKSFHHCDDKLCFLSATEGQDGAPVDQVTECHHWVSAVNNQTFVDSPSTQVYDLVLQAIRADQFAFDMKYKNKTVKYSASMSFHYRTPDPMDPIRVQFTLEASSMTITKVDYVHEGIVTLDECLALCVGWRAFRCETIVHKTKDLQCLLTAEHYHDIDPATIKPESNSFIHSRSYLTDYSPVLGGVTLNTTGPVYNNIEHAEACARLCSTEDSITCQSFEWCHEERVCHLHAEHFLDVADGGNYNTHTSCIHFSKKTDQVFSRYDHQGLGSSRHRLVATNTDSSTCAKLCVEESGNTCESFDYCSVCAKADHGVCGDENDGLKNLCFLSHQHLGEPGLSLQTAAHCEHFSREFFGDLDYASWVARKRQADKPYTSGDMAGLAFGMIFLGLVLAIGFLLGVAYFRPSSVPKDFSISFVNLKTSADTEA